MQISAWGDDMLHIKNLNDGLELFKTLGSDVRMRIVELLSERGEMNMNEIATATRYNIPIIEVVFNNHPLGMVRQWQTLFYGKRYSQTILEDKVDYCKIKRNGHSVAKCFILQKMLFFFCHDLEYLFLPCSIVKPSVVNFLVCTIVFRLV